MHPFTTISHQTLSGDERLEWCRITDCKLEEWMDMTNCVLERCDLSNLRAQRCGIHGIELKDCRLTGISFADCDFRDVTMSGCIARYINCYGASFRNCRLEGCDCSEGVFAQSKWKKSTVSDCSFFRADCSGLTADSLDWSDSILDGALFSLDHLKGMTISPVQSVMFAKLLGLEIKD